MRLHAQLSSSQTTTPSKKGDEADLDIEEKILRRREMAHLFQWYYPEGGWGWIILLCAFLSQCLAHGMQFAFSFPMGVAIRKTFFLTKFPANGSNQDSITIDTNQVLLTNLDNDKQPIMAQHIGKFK